MFAMLKANNVIGFVSMRDLLLAGYDITPLGDCVAKWSFGSQTGFFTCDLPTSFAEDSPVDSVPTVSS